MLTINFLMLYPLFSLLLSLVDPLGPSVLTQSGVELHVASTQGILYTDSHQETIFGIAIFPFSARINQQES